MRKHVPMRVALYAAQECRWQMSGELSVYFMLEGWSYCMQYRNRPIEMRDVLTVGRLVEPNKNIDGFRKCGVRVGDSVKMDWRKVQGAMETLLAVQPWPNATEDEAEEWFRQYEEIHPWIDGNGRSGSLLHLWLLGRLEDPRHPPDCWQDFRRSYDKYPEVDKSDAVLTHGGYYDKALYDIHKQLKSL